MSGAASLAYAGVQFQEAALVLTQRGVSGSGPAFVWPAATMTIWSSHRRPLSR